MAFYESHKENKYLSRLSKNGRLRISDQTDWPPTDIFEDDEYFYMIMEIPGIPKEEVEIYIADDKLIILGERKFPVINDNSIFHLIERNYGEFKRVFQIPDYVDPDSISVKAKEGTLYIKFIKRS